LEIDVNLHRLFRLLLVLVAAGCLTSLASAGTVRDDLVPADYPDTINPGDPYLALAADPVYSSVGQLVGTTVDGHVLLASGVLIAPQWVLTAGHVVAPELVPAQGAGWELASLNFYINGQISGEAPVAAVKWFANPQFNPASPLGDFYDLGLVKLADEILGVQPAELYTGADELKATCTSVGYGATGTGLTGSIIGVDAEGNPILRYDGRKRAGDNVIDAISFNLQLLASDFDNPAAFPPPEGSNYYGDNSLPGSPLPLPLEFLIAFRDSGGGLFLDEVDADGNIVARTNQLVGIHLGGMNPDNPGQPTNSDYGDISVHTRVSLFTDWINASIPEPASFTVWSLFAALGITVGWRRKRRRAG
jgi:hypothetical protein